MLKISPSILSGDFSSLGDEVISCKNCGADMLHLDIMDGHFVPNITFGAPVVKALRQRSDIFFDVHLMISDPEKYISDFIKAGADLISFHAESNCDIEKCISLIKASGVKACLAIKPKTPAETVFPYIKELDMILVMTVEPGFGGQSFMENQLPKIKILRNKIEESGLSTPIQVDGGITDKTLPLCFNSGANVFVAGSFIFGADDKACAIKKLRDSVKI